MRKLLLLTLIVFVFSSLSLFAQSADAFVTVWNSSPASSSSDHEIRFHGAGNGYIIHWQEVGNAGHTGAVTAGNITADQYQLVDFGTPGQYKVWVDPTEAGTFQQFKQRDDRNKLINIAQWGTTQWVSFLEAFRSCPNLDMTATDVPDLSNVQTLEGMFSGCSALVANTSINSWNTSNIVNMNSVFSGTQKFNQPLNNWNTSNVTTMVDMFADAVAFNGDITDWNTHNVTNMSQMFIRTASFNQPIGSWDMDSVSMMTSMFEYAEVFNQSLAGWETSSVTDMSNLFYHAVKFNSNINSWDVSHVTKMNAMFQDAQSFNQPLDNWNTSSVTEMTNMFNGATAFNQNINGWDVSHVTSIAAMFDGAVNFNQPVNNWNTVNVTDMSSAFHNASSFNQPLSNWKMGAVKGLNSFLLNATSFNQDISNWNNLGFGSSGDLQLNFFLSSSGIDCVNYSLFLNAMANNVNLPLGISMGADGLVYNSSAQAAHNTLVSAKNWTFYGDTYVANCNGTVPVTLEAFNAAYDAPFTVIDWTTGMDDDLAYFEVQRSLDGKRFTALQKIDKQTDNPAYSYRYTGAAGLTYYRLKIVESTGKVTYSETKSVSAPSGGPQDFTLYPNPVRSNTLHVVSKRSMEVRVYNQLGQLVGRQSLEQGDNNIDVTGLASGVYWLRGEAAVAEGHNSDKKGKTGSMQSQKFIIQH